MQSWKLRMKLSWQELKGCTPLMCIVEGANQCRSKIAASKSEPHVEFENAGDIINMQNIRYTEPRLSGKLIIGVYIRK